MNLDASAYEGHFICFGLIDEKIIQDFFDLLNMRDFMTILLFSNLIDD